MRKIIALSFLLAIVACSAALAQTVVWNSGGAGADMTSAQSVNPCVVPDGSGGLMMFWQDSRNSWSIYGNRLNSAGARQWGVDSLRIDGATSNNSEAYGFPQAVPLTAGGAMVVWEYYTGGQSEIGAQRVNASGAAQWNAGSTKSVYTGDFNDRHPVLVSYGSGPDGVIVVWMHDAVDDPSNVTTNDWQIFACKLASDGTAAAKLDVGIAANSQIYPQACSDGVDGAFVVWMDWSNGTDYDIAVAHLAMNAGVLSVDFTDTVVCSASGDQYYPRIAADGSGGAVIAWQDYRDGDADVYAQRIDAVGAVQWTVNGFEVAGSVGVDEEFPCLTALSGGETVVVWEDNRSGGKDVYAQQLTASGQKAWTSTGRAVCIAQGDQTRPMVFRTALDDSYVVWEDARDNSTDVYCQMMDSDGAILWNNNGDPIGASGVTDTYNGYDPYVGGKAILDSSDNLLVAWQSDMGSGATPYDVYCQKVTSSGVRSFGTYAGQTAVSEASAQLGAYADCVSDDNGGAALAWTDNRNGNEDIYIQHFDAFGANIWPGEGVAVSTVAGGKDNARVVSDGLGGFVVFWNSDSADLYAQRVSASGELMWGDGTALGGGVAYCTDAEYQAWPTVVSDGAGGAFVVWMDERNTADFDLYAQHIGADGSMLWTAEGLVVCSVADDQRFPKAVSDGSGGIIVAWMDRRNGSNYDMYAQRIDADGQRVWTNNGKPVCDASGNQRGPDEGDATYYNSGTYGPFGADIIADGSGGAIIAWQDDRSGSWDIYAQLLDADGVAKWDSNTADSITDGKAVSTSANAQNYPRLAADGAGGAVIVWWDFRTDALGDIYAQRLDSTGALLWTTTGVAVAADAVKDQVRPVIVADGSSGAIVTWQDKRNNSQWDIYAIRLNSLGTTVSPGWPAYNLTTVASSTGSADTYPVACGDGAGSSIAFWETDRHESGVSDIFGVNLGPALGASDAALSVTAGASNPAASTNVIVDDPALEMLQLAFANTGTEDILLEGVTFTASGTAHDGTDIAEVVLISDSDGDGQRDSAEELLGVGAYDADGGKVSFKFAKMIPASSTLNTLLVYALSGSAGIGDTFVAGVSSAADVIAFGKSSQAYPAVTMVAVTGATMTVNDTGIEMSLGVSNPPAVVNINTDDSSLEMILVKVQNTGVVTRTMVSVTFTGSGTGNEPADITSAGLYLDSDSDGIYDTGTDTLLLGGKMFASDNGTIVFTLNRAVSAGVTEYWLLVYSLAGTASPDETFTASISSGGDVSADVAVEGLPLIGNPMTIAQPPSNTLFMSAGPSNPGASVELNNATNVSMVQIMLEAETSTQVQVNSVTFMGSGSGDDSVGISGLSLYRDNDGDGVLTEGDEQIGAAKQFISDDGSLTFAGTPLAELAPFAPERWIVVATFAGNAATSSTFALNMSNSSDITLGTSNYVNFTSVNGGVKTIIEGISAAATSGTAPFLADFTASFGTASVVQYQWDFDYDESKGFRPDYSGPLASLVMHKYWIPGTYVVRIRADYADGTVVYDYLTLSVQKASGAPTASATVDSESFSIGPAPLTVSFLASASSVVSEVAFYAWDFDADGVIDWSSETGGDAEYTYRAQGSYTALFIACDREGNASMDDVVISVQPPEIGDVPSISSLVVPVSSFVGEQVSLSASVSAGASGTVALYEWDFEGDGLYDLAASSTPDVVHVYSHAGTYFAALRITDSEGLSAVSSSPIEVSINSIPSVWIVEPVDGTSVSGDLVSVRVMAAPHSEIQSVGVQYRLSSGSWTDIGDAVFTASDSYVISWDVVNLLSGTYELRAVAVDTAFPPGNYISTDNYAVEVVLVSTGADVFEGTTTSSGEYAKNMKASAAVSNLVTLYDGSSLDVPYGVLASDEVLTLNRKDDDNSLISSGYLADSYREVMIVNNEVFSKPVWVTIPYEDSDSNGYVDGTQIAEESLSMMRYDEASSAWVVLSDMNLDPVANFVKAMATGQGVFALVGTIEGGTVQQDTTPPIFAGAGSAEVMSSTSITLEWDPATDNSTAASGIVYLIYLSTTSGGQNLLTANIVTSAGSTQCAVPNLLPDTLYYFVVRAKDASQNIDTNFVEVSARTEKSPPPPEVVDESGAEKGPCFLGSLLGR